MSWHGKYLTYLLVYWHKRFDLQIYWFALVLADECTDGLRNLRDIMDIKSWTYHGYIMDISWIYHGYIMDIMFQWIPGTCFDRICCHQFQSCMGPLWSLISAWIWGFPDVWWDPQSSYQLIPFGCELLTINHPFWDTPIYGNPRTS